MICFGNPLQAGHHPAFEFFRGERVPCHEHPGRMAAVQQALAEAGVVVHAPDADSGPLLARVHAPRYLDFLHSVWARWLASPAGREGAQPFPSVWPVRSLRSDVEPQDVIAQLGLYSFDNGTPLVAGTWAAVRQGADAAVSAARRVAGGAQAAWCLTRPPGHHAGPDFMGGYCFLNNAALAAEALLDAGARRVAVLDVDYHHGNGTQSIFWRRSDVLFASLHGDPRTEYPFYLGHADEVGEGDSEGFNLNLPLPAGTAAPQWFAALDVALDRVRAHAPDALVVSLGLDTYEGDPISRFSLGADDFSELGRRLAASGLPAVFVLEGGYASAALGHNLPRVMRGVTGA